MGPLLFTTCINNIVPPSLYCDIHYYADDTFLYSTGKTFKMASTNLQSAFDVFQLSLIKHKLVLNPEKAKCMLFSRSHGTDDSIGIPTLQSTQIETVDSYKYLGIWLNSRLSFWTHVEHLPKAEGENWFPVQIQVMFIC